MYNFGQAWEPLALVLASRGFHVIAVDLAGHGLSPRASTYPRDLFADAVLATVPSHPALLVGHSFGGYVAQLIAGRLHPERQVLVDPALEITGATESDRQATYERMLSWATIDPEQLERDNSHWTAEARRLEVCGREFFDPGTLAMLLDTGYAGLDLRPACPSLVLRAELNGAVGPELAARLAEQGHVVRTMPGLGHNMDRDDPAALAAAVDEWIDS